MRNIEDKLNNFESDINNLRDYIGNICQNIEKVIQFKENSEKSDQILNQCEKIIENKLTEVLERQTKSQNTEPNYSTINMRDHNLNNNYQPNSSFVLSPYYQELIERSNFFIYK